jgi:prepilin-type N-terminal cleavage/methylation domain-containing protein
MKFKKGFSLVEVMIALVIVGGLSAILGKLILNSVKGQKGISQKADMLDTANLVRYVMQNSKMCGCNLGNAVTIPEHPTSSTEVTLARISTFDPNVAGCTLSGASLFETNEKTQTGLKITSLKIVDIRQIGSGDYLGKLEILGKKSEGNTGGFEVRDSIPLRLTSGAVSGGNVTLTGCKAPGVDGIAPDPLKLAGFECNETFGDPGSTPPAADEVYVMKGFRSNGTPHCVKVKSPPLLCKCCIGAIAGDLPGSIQVLKNTVASYRNFQCQWDRTVNPIAFTYQDTVGIKGTSCSVAYNDAGSDGGLFVRDCDDGTGWQSATNTYVP